MDGFKDQTGGIEKEDDLERFFWTFLRENKLLLGGNT